MGLFPRTAFLLARALLLTTLLAAPWLVGSVQVWSQLWISAGILLALLCWGAGLFVQAASGGDVPPLYLPRPLIPMAALALIGAAQLLPLFSEESFGRRWSRNLTGGESAAEVHRAPGDSADSLRPASLAPAVTRLEVARLVILACAFFLGAQLFRSPEQRLWLYGALAATGAALAIFGLAQRLSWNGELFWTIPLRYRGGPFASFVNRNNAAGFLNISLGAALGGLIVIASRRWSAESRSRGVVFAVLALLVGAGLAASLSRGGIAAGAIALAVVSPRLAGCLGRGYWIALGGAGLAVVGLTTWLGFQGEVSDRLNTLRDAQSQLAGRVVHWQDTAPAILDRPWLGSGWGTYRYVSPPYQQRTSGWYWHADNQYFEIAVEAGLWGVAFAGLLLMMLVRDLLRLWRRGPHGWHADLSLSGAFVMLALGLHQVTDFGITLMAISLPAAVLFGAASSVLIEHPEPDAASAPPSRLQPAFAAGMFAVVGGLAVTEIALAEGPATFRGSLPLLLDRPDALAEPELDAAIERGRGLLSRSPDDAELHYQLARLYIYRYRQEFTRRGDASGSLPYQHDSWWLHSRLENLFQTACLAPDRETLEDLRNLPLIDESLGKAAELLRRAERHCEWLPGLYYDRAMLAFLEPEGDRTGARWLRRAAELDAADPDRLMRTSLAALQGGHRELALLCWKRALKLEPDSLPRVVEAARRALSDREICEHLIDSPEHLVAFSGIADSEMQGVVRDRLQRFLREHNAPDDPRAGGADVRRAWIAAHAARLDERPQVAIEHLEQAVALAPLNIEWRLQLADLLLELEEYAKAREHLTFVRRLVPRRPDVERRLKQAVEGHLRQPSAKPPATRPIEEPDQSDLSVWKTSAEPASGGSLRNPGLGSSPSPLAGRGDSPAIPAAAEAM